MADCYCRIRTGQSLRFSRLISSDDQYFMPQLTIVITLDTMSLSVAGSS
jgi:hypothetical protein